jgi:hypothetical protein
VFNDQSDFHIDHALFTTTALPLTCSFSATLRTHRTASTGESIPLDSLRQPLQPLELTAVVHLLIRSPQALQRRLPA